jgi:hypothetical protein
MSPYDLSKQELLIDIKGYSKWKLELSKKRSPECKIVRKKREIVRNKKKELDLNKDKDNYGKNSRYPREVLYSYIFGLGKSRAWDFRKACQDKKKFKIELMTIGAIREAVSTLKLKENYVLKFL